MTPWTNCSVWRHLTGRWMSRRGRRWGWGTGGRRGPPCRSSRCCPASTRTARTGSPCSRPRPAPAWSVANNSHICHGMRCPHESSQRTFGDVFTIMDKAPTFSIYFLKCESDAFNQGRSPWLKRLRRRFVSRALVLTCVCHSCLTGWPSCRSCPGRQPR